MSTSEAAELSEIIHQKMEDFKRVCKGLDEETASHAPAGRWSPKEIVSHLCGPEGRGHMPTFQAFIESETPRLDIEAENPFFSEERERMTWAELLAEFDSEYDHIADFATGLSKDQLSRKAHIPMLKNSTLGEYPTLAAWIRVIGDHHLGSHTEHMREILQGLGVPAEQPRA
jgi:hypothetical protein